VSERFGLGYIRAPWITNERIRLDSDIERSVFLRRMRLVSLDISNFRVIRQAHLDFPDAVIGIIGRNGAGKSSIVEAIAWALYGNLAARSVKDEIKAAFVPRTETCEVGLEFEVNQEHYRVIRRLAGKSDRPEVELYHNNVPRSVGSTETRGQIEKLLGLDLKGFQTSFLAQQQELNALSDLPPHKRREHLAGMLGIERLDKAIESVKTDARFNAEKAKLIERQVAPKEAIDARVRELRERISSLANHEVSRTKLLQESKARLDVLVSVSREHETRKAECSRIEVKLSAIADTGRHLSEHADRLTAEIAKLEEAARQAQSIQTGLQGFEQAKRQLDELKEIKSRADYRDDLQKQLDVVAAEIANLEQKKQIDQKTLERLERESASIPEDVDRQLGSTRDELEKARSNWAAAKAEAESTRRDLTRLRQQIDSINKIGPETVCDRCHRPFGNDLPAIKKHLEDERNQISEKLNLLDDQLAGKVSDGESLKQQIGRLDQQSKMHIQNQSSRTATVKAVEETSQRLSTEKKRRDQLTAQLRELGNLKYEKAAFDKLAARVAELERASQEYDKLTGRLTRLVPAREELQANLKKLATNRTDTLKLQNEHRSLGYDEAAFNKCADNLHNSRKQYEDDREKLAHINKEHELAQKESDLKLDQLATMEKLAEELEICRVGHYHGEKLRNLFTDFRTHVIARIRPRLSELSSQLMAEMTGGRYSMVELDEQYNLSVFDSTQYYGVDRFSGGEKDLANLCLRLAISLALSESAGLERSFVILDEVFGSQDDSRRDLIFDGLVNLKNRFPQMLLISHIEEIKDKVECLIQVERTTSGWSEVKLNGSVV